METLPDARSYLCKKNALDDLASQWKSLWGDKPCFLVSDGNTHQLCGNKVKSLLQNAQIPLAGDLCFPGSPLLHARYEHVQELAEELEKQPEALPLVIGSGTLNDLVKRAAHEVGRPYGVIATAASVDGYASDGAALLYNGVKQTLACPAPRLILADVEILATAPEAMTSSGYGDLAGKVPAGADWILADILGEDPIHQEGWTLVHSKLEENLSRPGAIFTDEKALLALFDGLYQSGLAMQLMKDSRPVSGAEHLISHIWEMEGRTCGGEEISHGHKVALGSVITLSLFHDLLENPPTQKDFQRARERYVSPEERRLRIPGLFPELKDYSFLEEVNKQKSPGKEEFVRKLERLEKKWPLIETALKAYLPDRKTCVDALMQARCPVAPSELDIPEKDLLPTLQKAQYLRNRYTLLDLLYIIGRLEGDLKIL